MLHSVWTFKNSKRPHWERTKWFALRLYRESYLNWQAYEHTGTGETLTMLWQEPNKMRKDWLS